MTHRINERDDVEFAVFMAPIEGDGGESFRVGRDGVTAIKVVARPGPMDWLPYIEVWQGDHLHVEVPQHQIAWIEFLPAVSRDVTEAEAEKACAILKRAYILDSRNASG